MWQFLAYKSGNWELGHLSALLFFKSFILNVFIFGCASLHCCMQSFSSCNKQGLLSSCTTIASHCSGSSCWEAWALGSWASVIAVCGFSSSYDISMASARILIHKFQFSGYVWDISEPHVNFTTNIVPFVRVHGREKYYFSLNLQ